MLEAPDSGDYSHIERFTTSIKQLGNVCQEVQLCLYLFSECRLTFKLRCLAVKMFSQLQRDPSLQQKFWTDKQQNNAFCEQENVQFYHWLEFCNLYTCPVVSCKICDVSVSHWFKSSCDCGWCTSCTLHVTHLLISQTLLSLNRMFYTNMKHFSNLTMLLEVDWRPLHVQSC